MTRGSSSASRLAGDPSELLPMIFARPQDALKGAHTLLAGTPTSHDASIAHQVIGIWQRDFGDLMLAISHLRRARTLAVRSGSRDREADVLAALGVALVTAGRTAQGLSALETGASLGDGLTTARVLFRKARILWVLGRHDEALKDLRQVVPVLRQADDTIWTARALTLRGLISLATGDIVQTDRDFLAAQELWDRTHQEFDLSNALVNRGMAAFRTGDLPTALRLFDEAGHRYEALGTPAFELDAERCAVMLAAGLTGEACAEADAALDRLARLGGQPVQRAELLLVAARAALAARRPEVAAERATIAIRLFSRQGREWWKVHAQLVLLQARFLEGRTTSRSMRDAAVLAQRLGELRSPDAVQASLLAGRMALVLTRPDDADRYLAAAARARLHGLGLARLAGWVAHALRAEASGSSGQVLRACRRGLDVLDEYRMTLGAAELRARVTAQGAELAALAQRTSLRTGGPGQLLAWSERWRATALAVPPVHPPEDPELLRDVAAFREVAVRVEAARSAGTVIPVLDRELRRLEQHIRARTLRLRGESTGRSPRFDPRELLQRLGDGWLIEIIAVGDDLHVLLCGRGRIRRFPAGRLADASVEVDHVRATLQRLAFDADPHRIALLQAGGQRLQEALLGAAVPYLKQGPVVIVPPGRLHGVPWALLPALRERVVSVAPSANAWLRAVETRCAGDRVVLVRGPGLATGGAEVPLLADVYAGVTVLENQSAAASSVLDAIDGSRLTHIAAHGTFRADSPMFSSLRMDDGPITVHDFERLRRAPHRIVLSSCESGTLAAVGAEELLGLAAALLPLGTAGIMASSLRVNDEAAVPLMVRVHELLRAGRSMAEALRDAREDVSGDAVNWVAGLSFSVIGAA